MKYTIEEWDGLYCVYRQERLGQTIVGAYETKAEAIKAVDSFTEGR